MLIRGSRIACRIRFPYAICNVFLFQLSEMTADFAEEHSTSTLAAERIDAETSERLRLERELQDITEANKNLQQTTERLEMELLYARAADLNGVASDGEEGEDGGVYRQRYEHAIRELEFTKRKMAQQHEDDLEQLVGLKKQLEKKVRQIVPIIITSIIYSIVFSFYRVVGRRLRRSGGTTTSCRTVEATCSEIERRDARYQIAVGGTDCQEQSPREEAAQVSFVIV